MPAPKTKDGNYYVTEDGYIRVWSGRDRGKYQHRIVMEKALYLYKIREAVYTSILYRRGREMANAIG